MKVRTLFIHPEKGLQDISVTEAQTVEEVVERLEEIGCKVLSAEEEE